jgi:hypothetical protein
MVGEGPSGTSPPEIGNGKIGHVLYNSDMTDSATVTADESAESGTIATDIR